jgi:hypothetical protein
MSTRLWIGVALYMLLAGCDGTQARKLLLTEVGKNRVELYLDEPTNRSITLGSGYRLSVSTSTGTANTVDLGTFGRAMPGGSFFIVWEEAGYTGAPVAADFSGGQSGAVPGIKVAAGFMNGFDTAPSEARLQGRRNVFSRLIVIIPFFRTDVIDDVVRFGTPEADRPVSGGTFNSNGSLGNPSGSVHLQRSWAAASAPQDSDDESDWILFGQSWGARTP